MICHHIDTLSSLGHHLNKCKNLNLPMMPTHVSVVNWRQNRKCRKWKFPDKSVKGVLCFSQKKNHTINVKGRKFHFVDALLKQIWFNAIIYKCLMCVYASKVEYETRFNTNLCLIPPLGSYQSVCQTFADTITKNQKRQCTFWANWHTKI